MPGTKGSRDLSAKASISVKAGQCAFEGVEGESRLVDNVRQGKYMIYRIANDDVPRTLLGHHPAISGRPTFELQMQYNSSVQMRMNGLSDSQNFCVKRNPVKLS